MLDRALESVVAPDGTAPPPVLYHYTTLSAAEAILRSQVFWATAHNASNDEAELQIADPIFSDLVSNLSVKSKIVRKGLAQFLSLQERRPIYKDDSVYLTCFSLSRDDRNQWSMYGDKGKGVCLGIRILQEQPRGDPYWTWKLMPVEYSEAVVRQKIQEDLRKFCDAADNPRMAKVWANVKLIIGCLRVISAGYSISTKSADWKDEKEIRNIVIVRDNPIAPRKVKDLLKHTSAGRPYLEVQVRRSGLIAIAEIIVGAAQDADMAIQRIQQALQDAGYSPGDFEYPQQISVSQVDGGTR